MVYDRVCDFIDTFDDGVRKRNNLFDVVVNPSGSVVVGVREPMPEVPRMSGMVCRRAGGLTAGRAQRRDDEDLKK